MSAEQDAYDARMKLKNDQFSAATKDWQAKSATVGLGGNPNMMSAGQQSAYSSSSPFGYGNTNRLQVANEKPVEDIQYGDFEDVGTSEALNKMQEFYDHLNGPLDYHDPGVQNIIKSATQSAMRQSNAQGVRGGLAIGQTQANVGAAIGDYSQKRNQLYAQGMDRLAQLKQQAHTLQQGRYERSVGIANAKDNASQEFVKNAIGTGVQVIGTAVGAPVVGAAAGGLIRGIPDYNTHTLQGPGYGRGSGLGGT